MKTQMIKYGIAISLILNAILLMAITGILPFLLYLGTLLNIFLIWYIVHILNMSNEIREETLVIFESIENFADHLEEIHELEAFYGDQNLQNLIEHSKTLINQVIDLQEKFYDDIEVTIEDYDNEETQNETAPPEE